MEKLSKRKNRSLPLLLLMFLSIFSMTGMESVKDAHADETWREWRMKNIEKELNEIKSELEALALRKEGYLQNNTTDIRSRISKKYNEDVEALDKKLVNAYNQYRARPENRNLAEGVTKSDWRRTPRAKDLLAASELRKMQLRVAYFADLKKLKNGTLRRGIDNIFDDMDREQNALLLSQKELNEELEFLKTHTDEEAKARRDRLIPGFEFRVSVIGNTVRNVNIGDSEEVELIISTGTMPLTLEIIAEDGSKEVKTLTKSGRLKLPFRFTTLGNKTRKFILTDSSNPISSSSANVMFIVLDNTAPAIDINKTATPSNINKGDTVKYTYKITNPGKDLLSITNVGDDICKNVMFIPGGDTNNDGKLDPGEIWTYECSMTLNADTTNTATAKATGSTGKQVSDQDTAKVTVNTGPAAPTTTTGSGGSGTSSNCPPPKVEVPYIIFISEAEAESILRNVNLRFRVTKTEHSSRYDAGKVMDQFPYVGECVDPETEIKVKVSLGPPEIQSEVFEAKFNCGDSFELSPNDILYPKICNVLVRGYNNSDERVRVSVTYNNRILRVFPDDQSVPPYLMYPSTAGQHSGYYVFSINFSTTATAPAGLTTAVVTVRQGTSSKTFPLTILVLPPGQEPSSGTGIRPPAETATGSGGEYCVWRYKSFGDPPNCFNFVRAKCDTPAYSSNNRYELVDSNMTPMESAVRVNELGSYHNDAYGCHTTPQQEAPADNCPTDDNKTEPGMCGCNNPDVDSDSDGVCDHLDQCRGIDSSGDSDEDGICDDLDQCRGIDSSGDSDSDGVCNNLDPCPYDNPDNQDTDSDGTDDCHEECDQDPNKTEPGICGCGVPDDDSDGDGILDCQELICTGNTEEFNGRCVPKCSRGYIRDASGNCVFDPKSDIRVQGDNTCMGNNECLENYLCINYKCIPKDMLDDLKPRKDDGPVRGPDSGSAGGGASASQGDYGKSGCSYDEDCSDYKVCENGRCVDSDYPPYNPPWRGDRHGKDVEDFVDDFIGGSGGGGRSGGGGGSRSGGDRGGGPQPETPGTGDKEKYGIYLLFESKNAIWVGAESKLKNRAKGSVTYGGTCRDNNKCPLLFTLEKGPYASLEQANQAFCSDFISSWYSLGVNRVKTTYGTFAASKTPGCKK